MHTRQKFLTVTDHVTCGSSKADFLHMNNVSVLAYSSSLVLTSTLSAQAVKYLMRESQSVKIRRVHVYYEAI